MKYAILEDGKVVECDFQTWSHWIVNRDLAIAQNDLTDNLKVRTVFKSLTYYPNGLWFRTILTPQYDGVAEYETLEEALAGHQELVKKYSNT
jgi:hypothetical protein